MGRDSLRLFSYFEPVESVMVKELGEQELAFVLRQMFRNACSCYLHNLASHSVVISKFCCLSFICITPIQM